MQAKALAKDATDGGTLRQSAQHLPLVLMSEKGSSTDDVWRGIEVGAADVLEKPLSLLKLRNIWQHVVRKVGCDLCPSPRQKLIASTYVNVDHPSCMLASI